MATTQPAIEGLKLIRHNAGGVDLADDPSYPFKLEVNLRVPEFMNIAFVMLYGGSEEVVVRAQTKEALAEFLKVNDLTRHPRLRWMITTGPDGFREEIKR